MKTYRVSWHSAGWLWFVGGEVWICRHLSCFLPDGCDADELLKLLKHKIQ